MNARCCAPFQVSSQCVLQRDAVVIAELPDHQAAIAMSLAVSAKGSVAHKTTVLISPEEVHKATHQSVSYTGAGD